MLKSNSLFIMVDSYMRYLVTFSRTAQNVRYAPISRQTLTCLDEISVNPRTIFSEANRFTVDKSGEWICRSQRSFSWRQLSYFRRQQSACGITIRINYIDIISYKYNINLANGFINFVRFVILINIKLQCTYDTSNISVLLFSCQQTTFAKLFCGFLNILSWSITKINTVWSFPSVFRLGTKNITVQV